MVVTHNFPDDMGLNQLEKYVLQHADSLDELSKVGVVDEFEVPWDLKEEYVIDICNGRAMRQWFADKVDFYEDYYQNWILVRVNGIWEFYKVSQVA